MQVDLAQVSEDLGAKFDRVRARRFAGTPLAISVGFSRAWTSPACRTLDRGLWVVPRRIT
jgi:hypothetical protein